MHAYGQGTTKIQIRRHNTWDSAEMKNALYVPDVSGHLFSVKAAPLNGYSTTLDNESVEIREKISKISVMTGYVRNDLNMRAVRPEMTTQVNLVTPSDMLQVFRCKYFTRGLVIKTNSM
ncbi:hypothetical protein QE152_g26951 [Popillia japonica]|uniref:Uncharacterized protein n=1 Tax=Popillia japonica TaxID=7064 RepID=A0AAW1JWR9_POPJA